MARTGMTRVKGAHKFQKLIIDASSATGGILDSASGTRMSANWTNAGAPTNGTSGTFAGLAQPGDVLLDTTNKVQYQNTNTSASPTWTPVPQTGVAGSAGSGTTAGGAGGASNFAGGAGGAKSGTGAAAGGAGGAASVVGGAGGNTASSGSDAAGAGAQAQVTGGAGGNATAGTGNGGNGGSVVLTPGAGGTTTGGAAGLPGMVKVGGTQAQGTFGLNVQRSTISNAGTITDAQIRGHVLFQDASGGSVTMATRTGAQMDSAFPDAVTGTGIPLYVASNHATNTSTLSGGSSVTLVGSGAVTQLGGTFMLIKTGTGTWDLVRVG